MKSFLIMKYEMFLMRLYDFVVQLLLKTRCDWYPKSFYQREIDELQDKVWDLEEKKLDMEMEYERKINQYEYWLEVKEDEAADLWKKLEKYEPWRRDDYDY